MATVEQEIKMLSEKGFESFVHQVLLAKYPSAGIKRVDGSGGDQGIDCFSGTLAARPAVWQCKHLTNRIGPSQKKQILDSVETAFRHRELRCWTLCVPIDLRTEEHEWFQNSIVARYSAAAEISLIENSDLVADVSHNSNLVRLFFADTAISNLLRLSDNVFGKETRELLLGRVQSSLDHEAKLDPRLVSMIVVGPDELASGFPIHDSVFSIRGTGSAIHFFARDKEALSRDPIIMTCSFRAEVQPLVELAMDTGDYLRLPSGSVLGIDVTSPLLQSFFPNDISFLEFEFMPMPAQVTQ